MVLRQINTDSTPNCDLVVCWPWANAMTSFILSFLIHDLELITTFFTEEIEIMCELAQWPVKITLG